MKIHILGICGTFMGGIAVLAKQAGHIVSGSDVNVYPPMSTQLSAQGILLNEGYHVQDIPKDVDVVVVGNVISRGNLALEYVLNNNINYISGPQWLAENVLKDCWVLAVAGTHGKTTTASLLAWILQDAGLEPGFLIGGVPANFGLSARLGNTPFFVVEADEYDTAFFDKRSKFIHYKPRTVILNNLEFDHADIFENLAAIKKQFHHLVRTIPSEGLIIINGDDKNIDDVIEQGCWSITRRFYAKKNKVDWSIGKTDINGSSFEVLKNNQCIAKVNWQLHGLHNRENALAALIAAQHAGVAISVGAKSLSRFTGIKRRLEVKATVNGITIYDDFAHHPTAIEATLRAMQEVKATGRVFAILEPRSNTMRLGVHKATLAHALLQADDICLYQPKDLDWNLNSVVSELKITNNKAEIYSSTKQIINHVVKQAVSGDHILIMSNGGFQSIHNCLIAALKDKN